MKQNYLASLATATLTTVASLTIANSVQAAPPFTGASSGTWATPTPSGSPYVYNGVGTNTFDWGDADGFGTGPNILSFDGNSFSTGIDTPFQVGNLTYFNGTTVVGTTPSSVPLDVLLAFTDPGGLNKSFSFDFNLVSTENTGTPEENADFVFPPSTFSSTSFNFGGQDYTLQLLGFSKDGGTTIVNQFNVLENARDTAGLYAQITKVPKPIPEPSSLLGLMLLNTGGGVIFLQKKLRFLAKAKA
ncbi:choice-of-anchor K domain-containing protein [Nostoc sp. UHCC 0702]|nr:choice-of-anchor K domain-containing protein [Nostoc sp. UHCC 0702]